MYERKIDDEAENRARRRFEHYRDQFGSLGSNPATPQTPVRTLLVGAKEKLRLFIEDVIASDSGTRLKMLLEMARETLVDPWDRLQIADYGMPEDPEEWITEVHRVYADEFTPTLDSVVLLGLELMKYEARPEWMSWILDTLLEPFDRARTFVRLKSPLFMNRPGALLFAQPAYDAYLGIRALATYAIMRRRLSLFRVIVRKFVRAFTFDNQTELSLPVAFWPFSSIAGFPDMRNGRNNALWEARIGRAWVSISDQQPPFLGPPPSLSLFSNSTPMY